MDRRLLIKVGVVAALVAACRDHSASPGTQTGDVTLLRTASSLELLAQQTYDKVLVAGIVTTPALLALVNSLRGHHEEHADRLETATNDAGGRVYRNPNAFAQTTVVDPLLPAVKDEVSAVALAVAVETLLAETYAVMAGLFSAPDLRRSIMAIGGAEARHSAALLGVQHQPPAPDPFLKADKALGPAGYAK